MGFWSTNLYGNDITCDVRNDIITNLAKGVDLNSILKDIEKNYDEQELILFYLAAADTLWNYGLLTNKIKEKAIYYIDNNCLLDCWESLSQKKKWSLTLQKLKNKIMQPNQGTKKIVKKELMNFIPWNKGDIYAYKCHKKGSINHGLQGKFIVFQVIGYYTVWNNSRPVIFIYNKLFDEKPSQEELNSVGFLPLYPLDDKNYGKDFDYQFNHYSRDVWGYYQNDFKKKEFDFLFRKDAKYGIEENYSAFNYLDIAQFEQFTIYYYCMNNK